MGKKLFSLLLVGCLATSLAPGGALAADAEETAEPDSYIGDISADDADTVDDPADDAEAVTDGEAYTVPVSYTDVESDTCGENLTWVLEDGVLTISGTGEMTDFSSSTQPWGRTFTSAIIEDGVTSIGTYAFYSCLDLVSIVISDSVTSIGEYAFTFCTGLTSVTIPNGITNIPRFAFCSCTNLTDITIPDGVGEIGYKAFQECKHLMSVTIPKSVTVIRSYAFYDCRSLSNIYYSGNKYNWNAIKIYEGNFATGPTIHCNYPPSAPSPSPATMRTWALTRTTMTR